MRKGALLSAAAFVGQKGRKKLVLLVETHHIRFR